MNRPIPLLVRILSLVVVSLCLSACLNTTNRKIVLKEDVLKEKYKNKIAKQLIKKTYREKVAEKMEYERKRELTESEYREELHRETTRRELAALYGRIPDDPFEDFEEERKRVLNRKPRGSPQR